MPDWSKIGRSSRSRGNAYERSIAKVVNRLLGSNFVRTPASGGHAIEGDLYEAPGKQTKWSRVIIYCRTGWTYDWHDVFSGHTRGPCQWIRETPGCMWVFRIKPGKNFVIFPQNWLTTDGTPLEVLRTPTGAVCTLERFAEMDRIGFINVK